VSVNKPNISQIQQYLNGELDAKAMHALEKQAQDDPFLMDALEGYQTIDKDQQANLNDLKERFAERKQESNSRNIILWRVLPIAASVFIAVTIGWLWLSPKPFKREQAQNIPIQIDKQINSLDSQSKTATQPIAAANQPPATNPASDNVVAANNHIPKKRHKNYGLTTTALADNKAVDTANKKVNTIAGVIANSIPSLDILRNKSKISHIPKDDLRSKTITGVITDPTGHTLAGVKIAIKGTSLTAVTDTNGIFHITSPGTQGTLSVAYAGFDAKQIPLNGENNSIRVVLNESTNVLAQVSVPGYVDDNPPHGIHPLKGWKAFTDYIKKNAFMPNGETGRVKLAFTVSADGHINGIRIIRGKSDAMNQKAIELVLNGPEWKGINDTKELKLRIRFRKAKNT
jgi:hypothetical protein